MRTLFLVAGLAVAVTGAAAETASSPPRGSDETVFSLNESEGEYIKLNRRSGEVTICAPGDGRWVCRMVPDERLALEEEIARLSDENADLRAQLGDGPDDAPPSSVPPPGSPRAGEGTGDGEEPGFTERSKEELDRIMDFSETALRRFMALMESLREEYDRSR